MNRKLANYGFSGTSWGRNQYTFTFSQCVASLLLKWVQCKIQKLEKRVIAGCGRQR
jgi:hypothetical protein